MGTGGDVALLRLVSQKNLTALIGRRTLLLLPCHGVGIAGRFYRSRCQCFLYHLVAFFSTRRSSLSIAHLLQLQQTAELCLPAHYTKNLSTRELTSARATWLGMLGGEACELPGLTM